MQFNQLSLKEFIKKHNAKAPTKDTIENFKTKIDEFLSQALKDDKEEFQKKEISNFLEKIYDYKTNIKNNIDLAIYVDDIVNVIFEVKSTKNKTEFPKSSQDLLSKAFCESILYFLRERKNEKNNFIKFIIICNAQDFFIIDAKEFERLFTNDKTINSYFKNCDKRQGTSTKTQEFYEQTNAYLSTLDQSIDYAYFKLDQNLDDEMLSYVYQILSPQILLRQKQNYDANILNKKFYEELLYILGLQENDKKNIILSSTPNTLSYAIKETYKDISFDDIFALLIAWNNRILFLRLFESMLLSFKHIKTPFLSSEKIPNFAKMSELFFEVLAKKEDKRDVKEFDFIPYLNSSLFDKTKEELQGKQIKLLDSKPLEIYKDSILKKDKEYDDKSSLPLLEYLFAFLRAYDFTTTNKDIQNNQKTNHDKLINSSVLGNVFEKLNGYKEGSYYTPSFITSYMCKQSIQKVVLDKFNLAFDYKAQDLQELKRYLREDRIKKEEKIKILNSIKICDPAVGSGHFLVSALNYMINIYYDLNLFDNDFYLSIENDEILVQNNKNEFISYECPTRKDDKAHLVQKELFKCKKDIIENCLFGVDINPNSCEITKLRLWVELLKFSYYIFENDKNTNTLQTLPNIDINIKCGNSLISYFDINKSLSHYPNIKERMDKYKRIVKDYKDGFYTDKTQISKEIKNLKISFKNFCLKDKFAKEIKTFTNDANEYSKKYGDFLVNSYDDENFKSFFSKNMFEFDFDENKAKQEFDKLVKLYESIFDLESANPFEWRFEFPEILDDDGDFQGFDLIIGNPPYIRQEELKELKPKLAKNYKVYKGTSDIYTYFYELGFNVLKENGILSFITSNKYTRAGYGEPLREFLLKNTTILEYIDLNGIKVFDSATVDTSILSFLKSKSKDNKFKYLALNNELLKESYFNIENILNFIFISQNSLSKESFAFNDESTNALKAKIEKYGTPLKDWHGLNIYRGILTGYNEAFIITTEKKDEILANCKDEDEKERTSKLIRKMLRGRDIKRYSYEWAGLWVINTHNGYKSKNGEKVEAINIEHYPSLKKHFDEFYPQLEKRADKGLTPYNLRNCAYLDEFEKEKIVWNRISSDLCFSYDNQKNFILDSMFSITFYSNINLKYLIANLNSSISKFWIKNNAATLGDGIYGAKIYIEKLPIPKINSKNQKLADELINLVDEILKAKEQDKNANTQELENKINYIVYKLYNLTEEEIKIIEGK